MLAVAAATLICGARSVAVEPADELRSLNAKQDRIIAKLDEMMNKIFTLDDRLFTMQKANESNEKEVRELKKQMETLRNEMNTLRSQLSVVPGSTSFASPLGGNPNPLMPPGGAGAAGLGTLQVRNDYPNTIFQVMVNGQTFDVLPNRTTDIRVPAGTFSYRVLGVDLVDRTRTVTAGGTKYARIYPIIPAVTP
jgi:hypothetical protein